MKVKNSIIIPIKPPQNRDYLLLIRRHSVLLEPGQEIVKVDASGLVLVNVYE